MLPAQGVQPFPSLSSNINRGTSPLTTWNVAGSTNQAALTTVTPSVDNLSAWPFVVGDGCILDTLALEVTAFAANEKARIAVYNGQESTCYPTSLVVESGELDCGSNGVKSVTGLNKPLPPGIYWMAFICGTLAGTLRGIAQGELSHLMGLDNTLGLQFKLFGARAYGAFPATFPGGIGTSLSIGNPAGAWFASS